MYADKITDSMRQTISETERRRKKQIAYNFDHGLKPEALVKSKASILGQSSVVSNTGKLSKAYIEPQGLTVAADHVVKYMTKEQLHQSILLIRKQMEKAAKELDFVEAARLRDEMKNLEGLLNKKS